LTFTSPAELAHPQIPTINPAANNHVAFIDGSSSVIFQFSGVAPAFPVL
jgi:hypothetical protein